MRICIYGKKGCERCASASALMNGEAEYCDVGALFDRYAPNEAAEISVATNGNLPIVVIETELGRLVLGVGNVSAPRRCEGDKCKL
jgi:hypothetical protein